MSIFNNAVGVVFVRWVLKNLKSWFGIGLWGGDGVMTPILLVFKKIVNLNTIYVKYKASK